MEHYYSLAKYKGKSSRLTCPSCGKPFCFSPYVDPQDAILAPECGRCDHESSCGYHLTPSQYFQAHPEAKPTTEEWRRPPEWMKNRQRMTPRQSSIILPPAPTDTSNVCTLPMDLVMRSVKLEPPSTFLLFLRTLFDSATIQWLVNEYLIGVTKKREAVFYQIDTEDRCRSGKIIGFDIKTGHRIKDDANSIPVNWVHTVLKKQGILPQDWTLTQCLFGEHLLKKYPDKVVCLVESEKTAIIGAGFDPDCVWVATGGKGQLNDKVNVLVGRKILAFPDIDATEDWSEKLLKRPYLSYIVSDLLETYASEEDRANKIDIADFLIRWRQLPSPAIIHGTETAVATPEQFHNPVMRQVAKYFSPEYWPQVEAFIDEFDLELVSVTRIVDEQ